ncbi:hypothetical protein N302_10599, partial [Corvus brachyrhynchos]
MLIRVPFSTADLDAWYNVAKILIKQHNPDWADIQLLLGGLTETERQLVLKTARDLAEDYYKTQQLDIKDHFPLQEPHWSPNRTAELEKLKSYQEWIAKGVERAIPKTLNWSALYTVRQGPSKSPSEFLD